MTVLCSCSDTSDEPAGIPTMAAPAYAVTSEETSVADETTVSVTTVSSAEISATATAAAHKFRLAPDAEMIKISEPSCRAAAMYCHDDDTLLYADNIHVRTAPASLTKLLTASVALKYLSPDTVCTVGTEQSMIGEGSSICYVRPGQELLLSDLITGMLMASGNDAAYAVAVNTARALDDPNMSDEDAVSFFCGLMNDFASEIGMTESHFTTPDGWDSEDQYTTAADLIILAGYAMTVPEINSITAVYEKNVVYYSGESNTWHNSNKLLDPDGVYYRPDVTGLKTGTTENAGSCLIASFEQGGRTYITVVVGCSSDDDRYVLTLKLTDMIPE